MAANAANCGEFTGRNASDSGKGAFPSRQDINSRIAVPPSPRITRSITPGRRRSSGAVVACVPPTMTKAPA